MAWRRPSCRVARPSSTVLPSPLSESYFGCRDAWQAYKDALNRNDTRGMELAERAARRHGDAHIVNLAMWPSLRNKAMLAIEKGFQPVADSIKANALSIPAELLAQYPKEEIIEGAIEIVGAEISANTELRRELIRLQEYSGTIASKTKSEKMLEKLNAKDREQVPKFGIYAEFSVRVSKVKPIIL